MMFAPLNKFSIKHLHYVDCMYGDYTTIKLLKKLQNNMENSKTTVYVKSAQLKEHGIGETKSMA